MRPLLVLLCLVAAVPAAARAQEVAYAGSLQYATGTYIFTEPTHTISLQNGLYLTAGPFRLGGSVPLIYQNSGAITVVGGSALPTGGDDYTAVGGREGGQQVPMGHGGPHRAVVLTPTLADPLGADPVAPLDGAAAADSVVEEPGPYELSLGDPFLSSGLELYTGSGVVRALELVASVKVPINDLDSGVGTGEWDWGLGGAATLALGPVFAFTDLTYWRYGDLPELELQDGLSVAAGLGLPLGPDVWVSAMGSRTNRIIETALPASSVSLGLSMRTGPGTSWTLLAGTGLSETAAGFTLSLGWRFGLGT